MLKLFTIAAAKPRDKPYKLSDGNGLHLLIEPTGSKLWRLRYHFDRKEKMFSLGRFPEVSVAAARDRRDEARKLLAEGIDPSQQKKLDKLAAAAAANNTFASVADEYIATLEDKAEATKSKKKWLLYDQAAALSERPITEITPAEILDVLKRIEKSGRRETAKKLRGAIGAVFRHAIVNLKATNDPTFPLRGSLLAPQVQHRPAITEEAELGALMTAIDEYTGWPTVKAALLFTALTMTRPGEVRAMRRSEVNWPKTIWSIPAERMKMRQPHDVPLSKQAQAVLLSVWELSEGNGLVFASIRSSVKPLSENAMNSALRRMGYTKDEVCSHGFRASASTILNEKGYSSDVIEAALAHQDENEIRRAYNRARYLPERTKLLQAWADHLDEFRKLSSSRNVA